MWRMWRAKKTLTSLSSQAFELVTQDQAYLLPGSEQSNREILAVYNASDVTIYIGGSDVTTGNGFPVASTKYMIIPAGADVYAVCGSDSKSIRLLELK